MSHAAAQAPSAAPVPKGHPHGLYLLFVTEMWERFSYYGMRALLVLYLITKTSEDNPGLGWTEQKAGSLYGWYTGLVYLTPLFGGWLADRILGTHRSMVIGGWIIAAGHFTLAFTEMAKGSGVGQTAVFLLGLGLIIIGTGFFKPCVSVMVGQLYGPTDPRRDAGFTIFYMGINLGAFFSGLVCGTLGEKVGWHWGFGSAGVGMVLGLIAYHIGRPRLLRGIGLPPSQVDAKGSAETLVCGKCSYPAVGLPTDAPCPECGSMTRVDPATAPLTSVDKQRIAVIFIMAFFVIFFWTAFEQAGSSMNAFAYEKTNRTIFGWEFPATWFQSVNPAIILLFAPVFAWSWVRLARRGLNPNTPVKFAMGLMLLAVGFVFMIFGALEVKNGGLASPVWLMAAYLFHTWGELCLSPIGLSMVTKLSPVRLVSLMMGVWFLANFASNLLSGYLFAYSDRIAKGEVFTLLGGEADFFLILVLAPMAAGLVLLLLSPVLRRMMHGKG